MTLHRCVFRVCLVAPWLISLQACSSAERTEKPSSSVVPPARAVLPLDSERCAPRGAVPSREGFFHEVLFAAATARTPRFDDYTANSYHVRKLDVIRGLPAQANACGVRLRAVLVLGPEGILWTYHVAALVQDGANIRVNALVMPHARITGKGTGVVSTQQALGLLEQIEKAPRVHPGLPTPISDDAEGDFSYQLLLARYDTEQPAYFHGEFNEFSDDPGLQSLKHRVDALLGTAKTKTYQ